MNASTYRKALYLSPDKKAADSIKEHRWITLIERDAISVLGINQNRKAEELSVFQFPFCSNDKNWIEMLSQVLNSKDFSVFANNQLEYWIADLNMTIVPEALLDSTESKANFDLLIGNKADDYDVSIESLPTNGLTILNGVPKALHVLLKQEPRNAFLPFLDQLFSGNESGILTSMVVKNNRFVLTILKDTQLQFCNWFAYKTPEDALYFLMATLESLNILHSDIKLQLSGNIKKGDDIHKSLSRFIGKIQFASRPKNLSYSYSFTKEEEQGFPLLLAASCE